MKTPKPKYSGNPADAMNFLSVCRDKGELSEKEAAICTVMAYILAVLNPDIVAEIQREKVVM